MQYHIRAEIGQPHQLVDFIVVAPKSDLKLVRGIAENMLRDKVEGVVMFSWRGQVVFVNSAPVEERRNAARLFLV